MKQLFVEQAGSESAAVEQCPRCGSLFFDYFDGDPGALGRAIEEAGHFVARVATAGESCPACRVPLELMPYLDEGPEIYRCGACGGSFLTPAQLGAVADYSIPVAKRKSRLAALVGRAFELLRR
jgi:Zn-finger nucleic acid-binding protein